MSIGKAVALLGLGRDNLRLLPCDEGFRSPVLSTRSLTSSRSPGKRISGSMSMARTGCLQRWSHPRVPRALADVDSVSVDAHKWLYQPLDCSVLLHREQAAARRAFSSTDGYAASLSTDPVEGDVFFEETIELSRRSRALRLWLSLRYHGLDAFRRAIAQNLRQAQLLADLVDQHPRLERVADVPLGAVCFLVGGRRPSLARSAERHHPGPSQSLFTCPTPRCAATSCSAHASPTTARQTPTWSLWSARSSPLHQRF
jgi:aromatic-L-amino-acid decarboxylase